jgi:hypothetical protein
LRLFLSEYPTVFYNQEDLWVRATEKYYDQVIPAAQRPRGVRVI